MATPSTIEELFTPLNERLYGYYETGKYIQQTKTEYSYHYDRHEEIEHYDSGHGIINDIGKNASLFDAGEVYQEADNYKSRVKNILENLEPTIKERIVHDSSESDFVQTVSEERKEVLLARHREELEYIINGLDAIMKVREINKVTNNKSIEKAVATTSKETVINLPEDFKVKLLLKHFEPFLTLPQAALFLHYLQELKMIPSYSNASLGKLAEALFARNAKNITTNLSEIHDLKRNKAELTGFIDVLQLLIKTIDKDLKDAR